MADASPPAHTGSAHPILRFLITTGAIAAFTAALARWLRGPSTDAFTEPSVWPPAKPWPPLDESAKGASQSEPAQSETPKPDQPEAAKPAQPKRRVQVVKKAGSASSGAKKKTVHIQAKAPAAPPPGAAWKAATRGACPDGFRIKVKVRSGLYHEPGMFAYDRTNPDRCYPSAEAAEADGFTRAKR